MFNEFYKKIASMLLILLFVGACAREESSPPANPLQPEPTLPMPTEEVEAQGEEGTLERGREAILNSIELRKRETFPIQVTAVLKGNLSDGCVSIAEINQQRDNNNFSIEVLTNRETDALCVEQLQPFEKKVELDVLDLSAGIYTVTAYSDNNVSNTFELTVDNSASER